MDPKVSDIACNSTVDAADQEQWEAITAAIDAVEARFDTTDRTFLLHVGGRSGQRNKQPPKTATTSRWPTRQASRGMGDARGRAGLFHDTWRATFAASPDGTKVPAL